MDTTEQWSSERSTGTLLGGRVAYSQFVRGYRTGIEPVLMAAAIPARPGETVLEAGCGAGAALLCLLHRVPDARGIGIEVDHALARLARENAAANSAGMHVLARDVLGAPLPPSDHAMANPPWHSGGTRPGDGLRDRALHGDGLLWVAPLARSARSSLTLALPASIVPQAIAALDAAGMRRLLLIPLWPRVKADAKLMLVQAHRGGPAFRVSAGLVLHEEDGTYTPEAEAVLRLAGSLPGLAGR